MSDFQTRTRAAWKAAVSSTFSAPTPGSASWTEIWDQVRVIERFMGINHALLPGGGGMDIQKISFSRENGCIELHTSERSLYVARPRLMEFEYVSQSPEESFFLLSLLPLKPTDVYEEVRSESEALLEIEDEYLDYSIWDRGFIEYDERGYEIPIPADARLVTRLLRGKILLVAKASLWNSDTATYDGRHDHLTAGDIRAMIERALA